MNQKILSAVSMLLLFILLFGSCGKQDANEVPETSEEETQVLPVTPEDDLLIIENGKALYRVVYPTGASAVVRQIVNTFVDGVYRATGVRLASGTDDAEYDPARKEILIGMTSYVETQTVAEKLTAGTYTICKEGSKIVLVGSGDASLSKAVDYYVKLQANF